MTLVTDGNVDRQPIMRSSAMRPALPFWNLAPGRAEMACGTTDTGAPTLIISTMALGTLGHILRRLNPVEGCTLLVQPALSGRM